jgi:hypothetical protein
MKKKLLGLSLAVLMMFTFAINVGAEEAKPEAKPETTPEVKPEARLEAKPAIGLQDVKKTLDEIKNYLGLSVYLQGGYTFNLRNPDSGTNEQRIFDQKANTFLIDLVQI